jgi:hypothetical protein
MPISRFGAYFQNNSRFDDATVDFYDVDNQLIGSVTATVPKSLRAWTWNGWQSDVPIRRVVVTGNDTAFLHGFIWFDDVTVTTVPPPPAMIIRPVNNVLACITDHASAAALSLPPLGVPQEARLAERGRDGSRGLQSTDTCRHPMIPSRNDG